MARKYMHKKTGGNVPQAGQALSQEVSKNPAVPMETTRSMLMQKAMNDRSHRIDLPEAMREKMEAAFGMNFGKVNLYESENVADAGAKAIAQGGNIAFAPGKADFNTRDGQSLLGHELSHVAAQARGEVSGGGYLKNNALESRADREGDLAAAGEQVYSGPVLDAPTFAAAAPMQAKDDDEDKKKEPTQEDFINKLIAIKKGMMYPGLLEKMSDRAQKARDKAYGPENNPKPKEQRQNMPRYERLISQTLNINSDVVKPAIKQGVSQQDRDWYQKVLESPDKNFMNKLWNTSAQYNATALQSKKLAGQEIPTNRKGKFAINNIEDENVLQKASSSDSLNNAIILQKVLSDFNSTNSKNEKYNQWSKEYAKNESWSDASNREQVKQWGNATHEYMSGSLFNERDVFSHGTYRDDDILENRRIQHLDRNIQNFKEYQQSAKTKSVKDLPIEALKKKPEQPKQKYMDSDEDDDFDDGFDDGFDNDPNDDDLDLDGNVHEEQNQLQPQPQPQLQPQPQPQPEPQNRVVLPEGARRRNALTGGPVEGIKKAQKYAAKKQAEEEEKKRLAEAKRLAEEQAKAKEKSSSGETSDETWAELMAWRNEKLSEEKKKKKKTSYDKILRAYGIKPKK